MSKILKGKDPKYITFIVKGGDLYDFVCSVARGQVKNATHTHSFALGITRHAFVIHSCENEKGMQGFHRQL